MILDAHYHLEPSIEPVGDPVRRMGASGIFAGGKVHDRNRHGSYPRPEYDGSDPAKW